MTEQPIDWAAGFPDQRPGSEPALEPSERARLRELEKENRELRVQCEFLSEVALHLAAELR